MIKEEDLRDSKGTKVFRDEESGRTYRAIVAAIAWPGIKPGCLVIGALEQGGKSGEQKPDIYILQDGEFSSTNRLLRETDDYNGVYKFRTVYLDNSSRAMMQNLYDFRRARQEEGIEIGWGTSPASLLEDPNVIIYYSEKIKERLSIGNKSLFFAEDSKLPPYLGSIKFDELKGAIIETHPLFFALGAVVCKLDSHQVRIKCSQEARKHREGLMEMRAKRNPFWKAPKPRMPL